MSRLQRIELLVFLSCFLAFAWFNQGGGWNQNARFAEVRAMVEEGRFAIDDYLVYKKSADGQTLERLPLDHAEYTHDGKRHRLCWVDMDWSFDPIGDHPIGPETVKEPMVVLCCSGDLGYVPADGHFHPNKPPGTQLLAVPGYFVIYHVERWLGINPDHWWYLSFNAWLTSVCSVGLISALGCVLFFRLARELANGATLPALLATFTFAFGTTFFPFATLLFDHDLTAAFFIAAYYCLRRTLPGVDGAASPRPMTMAYLAGFCCGLAVLTNYPAGLGVVALGFYAWLKGGVHFRRALAFCAGGIGPALVLGLYTLACYHALKLSNDFQSPLFRDENALFGMFSVPRNADDWWRIFWVFKVLLYSPFRGVFFFSPVLLMSLGGLVLWWRKRERGDAALCFSGFALFFVMNTFFNGFHAGFSAGPRYLVPGIAFLALPLVAAFRKWPRLTTALALYSIGVNLLLTATDAENPVGVGSHARVPGTKDDNTYNLVRDYAWPLFIHREARPLLEQQRAVRRQYEKEMETVQESIANPTTAPDERAKSEERAQKLERELAGLDRDYNGLLTIHGPVSVNPVGVFEGMFEYDFFPAGSPPTRWASFNVGELLWPESRWSLLPLFLVSGGLGALGIALARRESAARGE